MTACAEEAVRELLLCIGDDPDREGLIDTPRRVVAALREMTRGLQEDPSEHLSRTFADDADEMVVVSGIRFSSLCEHHLLPFSGIVSVGYLPQRGKVVGLSKIPRMIEGYALRPQMQERLTRQIAEAIQSRLDPAGVGVLIEAHHSCMGHRGAKQPDGMMRTSVTLGSIREKPEARAEFFTLCGISSS